MKDDQILIDQFLRGDQRAFDQLVLNHQEQVRQFMYRATVCAFQVLGPDNAANRAITWCIISASDINWHYSLIQIGEQLT